MLISLFTAGMETILSVKDEDSRIETFSFDSRILFQNPALFYNRFIKLLHKKYPRVLETSAESNYLIRSMIFALTGSLDNENGIILNNTNLNHIASPKKWNGFNLRKCFEDLITEDNIFLLKAGIAAGYGVKNYLPDVELPALVILLESDIAVSLVHPDGFIEEFPWNNEPIDNIQGKTAAEVLSSDAVNEIISSGTIGVIEYFTEMLSEVIDEFINHSNRIVKPEVNSIVLLTDKTGFIDANFLSERFQQLKLIIPDRIKQKDILVQGIFSFYELAAKNLAKVIRIEYWSSEELIYSFEDFEGFINHWKSKKHLANPDNEYRIYYDNGHVKRIKMRHLNVEEEIKEFLF